MWNNWMNWLHEVSRYLLGQGSTFHILQIFAVVAIAYLIINGSSLISRIIQLAVILWALNTFENEYQTIGFLPALSHAALILAVFFAPLLIGYIFKFIKSLLRVSKKIVLCDKKYTD